MPPVDPATSDSTTPTTDPTALLDDGTGGLRDDEQSVLLTQPLIANKVHYQTQQGYDALTNTLASTLPAVVNDRRTLINEPTRSSDTADPNDAAARLMIRMHNAKRLHAYLMAHQQTMSMAGELKKRSDADPLTAHELGIDSMWQHVVDATNATKQGALTALDFVGRNLSRGSRAISTYQDILAQGGSPDDAWKHSMDVIRGSEKGWTISPTAMGSTWRDYLVHTGSPDDFSTALGGMALDMILDPVNLLGIGASRAGIEISALQTLNKTGREMFFTKAASGMASGMDKMAAWTAARDEMRTLVNSSTATASQLLDMGGLKLGGYTLPGTAFIRKIRSPLIEEGLGKEDNVAVSLRKVFGTGVRKAIDSMGAWSEDTALPLPDRLRTFMTTLPDHLRDLGNDIGRVMNRTNPAAGPEWKAFKQAEYYSLRDYQNVKTAADVDSIFRKIDGTRFTIDELKAMSYLTEAGPEAIARQTPDMQRTIAAYTKVTDDSLLEEVKRGIFKSLNPDMDDTKRALFERWMKHELPASDLDPAQLASFEKIRLADYVPHLYRNTKRANARQFRDVRNRPPSITEPFANKRLFPTLREAAAAGLAPEDNLMILAYARLSTGRAAIVTHDFLAKAIEKFGINNPINKALLQRIMGNAALMEDRFLWQNVRGMRTSDLTGLLDRPYADHILIAQQLAKEKNVPVRDVLTKLNDDAKRTFIADRMRIGKATLLKQTWDKYVKGPTEDGLYDGLALAPARKFEDAVTVARQLNDPYYDSWTFMTAGGKADPAMLRRSLLPSPIVADLTHLSARIPSEMQSVMRLYDKINFAWKRSVTLPFPAFYFRNKLTNIVNSASEIGLGILKNRPDMWNIVWGKEGTFVADNGMKFSYSELREAAKRWGVTRAVYRRGEIGTMMPHELASIQQGSKLNPFVAGQRLALNQENADRMVLFLSSIKRGMPFDQAAERVNKFLFDYDDVSNAMHQVRRVIPFLTWTQKNLALQTHLALNQPAFFSNLLKIQRSLSAEKPDSIRADVEQSLLPAALHDEYGVRLDVAPQIAHWLMNVDLPGSDLDKLWAGNGKATFQKWLDIANPFLKDALEEAAGFDFYSGKDLDTLDPSKKTYDLIRLAPEPIKRFLDARQVPRGDSVIWTVNPTRMKILMYATAMTASRFYSTIGNATDKDIKLSHRLFHVLTGARIVRTNPTEERVLANEKYLFNEDKGVRNLLIRARQKFDDVAAETKAAGRSPLHDIDDPRAPAPDPDDVLDHIAIDTPLDAAELGDD